MGCGWCVSLCCLWFPVLNSNLLSLLEFIAFQRLYWNQIKFHKSASQIHCFYSFLFIGFANDTNYYWNKKSRKFSLPLIPLNAVNPMSRDFPNPSQVLFFSLPIFSQGDTNYIHWHLFGFFKNFPFCCSYRTLCSVMVSTK